MEAKLVTNSPLVSIVMCTYNGEKFIAEQLDSIIGQTYPSLEIIISDDRSTDNSFALLEEYAAKDARIRLYRNEVNLGYTKNFTKACGYASGSYIAFSDQDDVWHPEKIERMMKQWPAGMPLIYCNSVRFTDAVPWNAGPNKKYRRFEGTDARKIAIFNTISGHALMITKEFLPMILPFPEDVSYDWWAGAVAACHGGVGYIPEILVFQRVHGSNVTVGGKYDHNQKESKGEFNQLVLSHLTAFAAIPGMPEKHAKFFKRLLQLWSEAMTKKFHWPLYFFLLENRQLIFHYKKRKIGIISHIKHSYRLVSN